MRWPGRTATATCTSCDADLTRDAVWCGACGARAVPLAATGSDAVVDVVVTDAAEPDRTGRRDRGPWLALGVLLVLIATTLTVASQRTAPPEPLLGLAGNGSNMTSTGLPPTGLRLAWSHDLTEEGWWFDPGTFMVHDGRARLAGRVLDIRSGRTLRTTDGRHGEMAPVVLRWSGEDIVLVEQLTGAVVARHRVPAQVTEGRMWPSARHGDVTFYAGGEGGLVIRDDGTVLAELAGWHEDWEGWHSPSSDATAVVVRSGIGDHGGPNGDLRLVSLRDGSTLLERSADLDDVLLASVTGDRAVVSLQPDGMLDPGPEGDGPRPWQSNLVDLTTGAVLLSWQNDGLAPPRIVGRTPDGGTLLTVEREDVAIVWEVTTDGERTEVARVERWNWDAYGDGSGNGLLGTAAITDDGLLVELLPDGDVEARTLDGARVWRVAAEPGTRALRVDGGVVALLPTPSGDPRDIGRAAVHFLDASDGARLGSAELGPSLDIIEWGPRPSALVGDSLAIGHVGRYRGPAAVWDSRWVDVTSGALVRRADVFEPWADEDTRFGGADVHLAGMVPGPDPGTSAPAVMALRHGGAAAAAEPVLVLESGRFVPYALPDHDARGPDSWLEPVGVTATTVAAWSENWQDDGVALSTFLLDRATGEVRDVDRVTGLLLLDDLLVGLEREPGDWTGDAVVVGHDPATGARRWAGPTVPEQYHDVLYDDEALVIGDAYGRTAVALDDGTTLWRYPADEVLRTGGVIGPRHVLLATTGGEVLALDRVTGEEVWRTDVGAPITSLTGAGEGAVVATLDEQVVVLDGRGREAQRIALDGFAHHAIALGPTLVVQYADRVVGYHPDGSGFTADDEVDLP